MNLNVIFRKRPQAIPQSQMIGAGLFSDFIGGALGYVRDHRVKEAAVKVELLNGIMLHNVGVPSRTWVAASGSKVSGGLDLPPVGSLVFVLFPYGIDNPSGALVLFSVFNDDDKKHQAFLKEGEEKKVTVLEQGGLKTIYDRETGDLEIVDDSDSSMGIKVSLSSKEITVDDWNGNHVEMKSGGLTLKSTTEVKVDAPSCKMTGSLEVTGAINANGNIESALVVKGTEVQTALGTKLNTHMHPTAVPGSPSPPVPGS